MLRLWIVLQVRAWVWWSLNRDRALPWIMPAACIGPFAAVWAWAILA